MGVVLENFVAWPGKFFDVICLIWNMSDRNNERRQPEIFGWKVLQEKE